MDKGTMHACPNKEAEFDRKHGISGLGLFFAIVIPILAAGGFGWFVYTRWDGKFGQIRLGESGLSSLGGGGGGGGAREIALAIPVAVIAGIVALAQAAPHLVASLWRSGTGLFRRGGGRGGYQRPYNSRGSFAARRGDYGVVDDEDELLGAEDFEEEEEA